MGHSIQSIDTISVNYQLTQFVESLKSSLVWKTTGCTMLTLDSTCKGQLIADQPVVAGVFGDESWQLQEQKLNRLLTAYNQQLKSGQVKLPVEDLSREPMSAAILYLIQVEMFVLQNERLLIASN
jgi:hypothetical protein